MSHPPQQALYKDDPRAEVAPFLPDGVGAVLDVGCARGGFGRTLRQRYGSGARIVGVEAVAAVADIAREGHGYDRVVHGYFPEALDDEPPFDLITFNDVLEHIVDPWQVLRSCRDHLSEGGQVLATIPNIAYAPVVWGLARGRWEYTDEGILDRTHVRFFTRTSMLALMEDAGFRVEVCAGVNSLARHWPTDPLWPRRFVKRGLAAALADRQYLQFVVVGRLR